MTLPLAYNWRNLMVRRLSTLLTLVVVATVVAVLSILLSFSAGMRASLASSGSPLNVMVLQTGATAESTSIITPDEAGRIAQTPGMATGRDGQASISQELCVQASIPRLGPQRALANVAVRGVDPVAFEVHPEVKIVQGRAFEAGKLEAVVGRSAQQRYAGLQIGDQLEVGKAAHRRYTIVGVFESGQGALESEVWAPRSMIADSYQRRFISSAVVRLASAGEADKALAYLRGPTVRLQAKLETDYYHDLSSKTRDIVVLTTILIGIMAIGAVFAVANTMYAAVDGRRREIAMLRTLGFSRLSILLSFLLESLMTCGLACLCGLLIGSVFHGARKDYLSDSTWTVLAYEMKLTPGIVLAAVIVSMLVGIVGALAPALRAARTRVIEALRKA
jgi:putative ABC transport system permease protein